MIEKKQTTIGSDVWEWEETPEAKAAIEKLHKTIRELELKAPDYGVGK